MNKLNLNVLSINGYGLDIPLSSDTIFSGAIERQKDYASFLNKYIIVTPAKSNAGADMVDLGSGLSIHPIPVIGRFEFMRKAIRLADDLIKQEKIDCVVCDNPFLSAYLGVWLKRQHHIPLVVHSMAEMIDNPPYLKERFSNRAKNWLAKKNLKHIDLLRVSTQAEIDHMAKRGFDQATLHYAPFYIDPSVFINAKAEPEFRDSLLGQNFDDIVLFIGRIAKQKDVPTLVNAAEIVARKRPRTLFAIVGDGPEMKRVKNIVSRKGLEHNVRLLGKVPYSDVVKHYLASDIFAITSIYEGTCMVLHEAGISGLPVVATAFAGAIDYIENGVNGYLTEIYDHNDFADRINCILDSPEKKRLMGEASKLIVQEKFSRESALALYHDMFVRIEKLIKSKKDKA